MSVFRFLINRTLRREGPLMAMSALQGALLADLSGKRVALVGNSRALVDSDHGADIDDHDVVVRINRAPMPSTQSHGARTDWLALAVRLPAEDRRRINAARYLWMSHKRKRLDYATATSDGFYLHPLHDYADLKERLAAQPTTGAMLIDLLMRSDLSALTLFGFDFMASLSLSGSRTAERTPHNFAAEAAMVKALMRTDPRLTLVK